MEKITEFFSRKPVKWITFILITAYPTIDFYWGKFRVARELMETVDVNWVFLWELVPRIIYGLLTGLLFLLFIKAQSAYYQVTDVQRDLMRLNQLYKERFKMILLGDTKKLFTDFELELWRRRLHLKEPHNKKEVNDFVNKQRALFLDYGGKQILIDHKQEEKLGG